MLRDIYFPKLYNSFSQDLKDYLIELERRLQRDILRPEGNSTGTSIISTTDNNAIHDNVASEISAISEKSSLTDNDIFIIEDSEDDSSKKKVKLSNIQSAVSIEKGSQIITNPDFASATGWTAGADWTIDTSNEKSTYSGYSGGNSAKLYQTISTYDSTYSQYGQVLMLLEFDILTTNWQNTDGGINLFFQSTGFGIRNSPEAQTIKKLFVPPGSNEMIFYISVVPSTSATSGDPDTLEISNVNLYEILWSL